MGRILRKLMWQYKVLMWKNFLLLRRSPIRIFVEILWPLVLFLILWGVRTRNTLTERKSECHFHNKPMPSAGLLPFFQGIMCTSNNTCIEHEVTDELSKRVTSFQTTNVQLLVADTAQLLSNDSERNILLNAVQETQKLLSALEKAQRMDEPIIRLLGINETSYYNTLQQNRIPLSNRTVDLLLNDVTINRTALLSELLAIQSRNPEFVPLLETMIVDLLTFRKLMVNDSTLLIQAIAEDLETSLSPITNLSLSAAAIAQRLGKVEITNTDTSDALERVRNAKSIQEVLDIFSGVSDQAGAGPALMKVLDLSSEQQNLINDFCIKGVNQNSSACLLQHILSTNGTARQQAFNDLCSQTLYKSLVTCMLWDFNSAGDLNDALEIADTLCKHRLLGNTSLCGLVDVQKKLTKILMSVDPREILCNDNTTILEYSSAAVKEEVKPPLCNMTRQNLTALLAITVEHLNVTAVRQLYFPDGFDPLVVIKTYELIQQLQGLPSVKIIIADIQTVMNQGLMSSFCGVDADIPLFQDEDDMFGTTITSNINNSTSTTTKVPPTTQRSRLGIFFPRTQTTPNDTDDPWSQSQYVYKNSTEWEKQQFCYHLFSPLRRGDVGNLVFRQLEPILFGKIPYSPSTAATNQTIAMANYTFQALATIKSAALEIRSAYRIWENTLEQLGQELFIIDELLNLSSLGNFSADSGLVSQQEFLLTVLAYLSPNSSVNASQIPNITELMKGLSELSRSLQSGGEIWEAVDRIGSITGSVYSYLDCVELNKFEAFASEYDLEKQSLELIKQSRFWAGIVFDDSSSDLSGLLPSYVRYKIRMNTDKVDDTDRIQDKYWTPGPRSRPPWDTKYITYGFAYLQDMIEHALINLMTNDTEKVGIYLQQFPYPCYTIDYFVRGISRSLPLFMVLSWIFSVALLVKSIVYEKQERLREQMKIMGLTNGIQWFAWYTTSFVLIAPSIVCLCIIFKYGRVLQAADPSVMALLLFAFSFATTGQAFMFSVFFTRANLAACCGAIFYFALYLPYSLIYQYEEKMTTWMKGIACLLSPVSFGLGTSYVSRYEEQGVGINWSNINVSPVPDDTFSLAKCILMLFVDGCLYWIFAWYKEHVFPGKYGMPKPFYFLFTRGFWCGSEGSSDGDYLTGRSGSYDVTLSPTNGNPQCETEPTHLKLGVQIKELSKIYSNGRKVAVDGLSLNLYENQITSFLGHNGAGKTTTMSILCGLFPPSKGTAVVYGNDIRSELDQVRQSMGFCPQFNVLYETLTVSEHILFYGQLKGLTYEEAVTEMNQMVQATGMTEKKDANIKSLSGGMKRKVSVMCAFVGGSKCVILDEPTAGVDPYSRRQIWDLLLKFKHGRTILLSTHHMDEADFLGDRIAIISHGKLCCSGSSLYLKGLHGNGYYLTIVRETEAIPQEIEKFVLARLPGSVLMESIGQEMVFQLPAEEVKTGAYGTLFSELDEALDRLGIASYGICDTTLEEVFLKIAEETGVDAEDVLTDGGNLAKPHNRRSIRFRSKFKKALNKISDNIACLNPTRGTYRAVDDDVLPLDGRESFASAEPGEDRNQFQSHADGNVLRFTTETADDELADSEEEEPRIANTGHLSISYNSSNNLVSLPQDSDGERKEDKVVGWRLIRNQVFALVIKRFHHVRRDKIAFLCEIVLPALFVLLAMAFALAIPPVRPQPALELQPWMYEPEFSDRHLTTFFRNDYPDSSFTKRLEKLMMEGQYSTRCMDSSMYEIPGKKCKPEKVTTMSRLTGNILPQCECNTTGYQFCDAPEGYPANSTVATTDYVVNLTSQDVSKWLVKTMTPFIKSRYGGFGFHMGGSQSYVNESDVLTIIRAGLPDAVDEQEARDIADSIEDLLDVANIHQNVKVWFNNKGWASSVNYMNSANNLILRSKLLKAGKLSYSKYGITALNHPMNRTDYQLQQKLMDRSYVTLLISLCIIFAMSLIPATFVLYLIMDRVSTSKNLQFVSGMNRCVYWCTHFTWDMFSYVICASLCFLIFLAFNEQAYVSSINGPCLAVLIIMYGWAMIPLMYLFNYLFKESSIAFVALGCLNIFLGIVSTTSTFILETFPEDDDLRYIAGILKKAFLVMPHYCLGRGLMDLSVEHLKTEFERILGKERKYNPFSWDITGKNMCGMLVEGICYFSLVMLIELGFFDWLATKLSFRLCKPSGNNLSQEELEDDVQSERNSIISGDRPSDTLLVKSLSKCFKGKKAVNDLTFGVPQGQCFGLLGVNGAGKTTTFNMLTGIMRSDGGDAILLGNSVSSKKEDAQKVLGYCPQFDAIDPLLTGREHLEFYARLRGVPFAQVKSVASRKLKKMGLTKYENKRAGDLSGGNKRKLQSAIALIGNPAIIFMDEPTTGMDPKARRFLWDSIIQITKEGHAVVLTSHSMEECEVLCSRLAIMVNGKFRCLGSPQHLKNKYGEGYHVSLRIKNSSAPDIGPLLHAMDTRFNSSATLLESSLIMAQYHISNSVSVAIIFSKLEEIRLACDVEDYSVTQTSLDHVFIRFAKQQSDSLAEEFPYSLSSSDTNSLASHALSDISTAGSQVNLIV